MKKLSFSLFFVFLFICYSCNKNDKTPCNSATVENLNCGNSWNIKLADGKIYHSYNLSPTYQQPGLNICIEHELYQDPAMCACCGGTAIRILSIQLRK
ncbi:MAG TPA: hypothetical protein VHQ93_10985 [Chitinophagaceae bacterium]|nr:hypothetical protein [Chitinophagaceae bacterium]